MVILVKLLSVIIMAAGVIFAIKPGILSQYVSFWKKDKNLKLGAVISLLVGVLFILAAPSCKVSWVIIVFGVWGIIKGSLLFVLGEQKIVGYLDMWLKKPVSVIRSLSGFAVALGILLFFCA